MKYSLFIGRWQPWHEGHRWLIDQQLNKGRNVCIAIRDVSPDSKNPFTPEEVLNNVKEELSDLGEKIKAKRAFNNSPLGKYNEYGDFLGKSDIAQIRFLKGSFDMATLLNIVDVPDTGTFNSYNSSYWECSNWNTDRTDCFEKSPVDDIFISEYSQFKESCLFEFNFNELDGKLAKDSSGNGNKAILFGDFAIKKEDINKKSVRDSYIKTSKLGRKNGAI